MKTTNLLICASVSLVFGILSSCKKDIVEPGLPNKELSVLENLTPLNSAPIVGGWNHMPNQPSDGFSSVMMLLSDGTVAVKTTSGGSDFGGNIWLRLTPDATGSYLNGRWSNNISPMRYTRHFFSSVLLPDGRLYVAGGEYGNGHATAEIYDPLKNTWIETSTPPGGISDASALLLNNGTILQSFVEVNGSKGCSIYNPTQNTWGPVFSSLHSLNEGTFVQLPDQSVLNIDIGGGTGERYIPSLSHWIADANPSINIYGPDGETGPGLLLPNKQAFFMGANGKTIYYKPSNSITHGTWVAGPPTPGGLGADDAGANFMVNGKILFALGPAPVNTSTGPSYYQSPTTFFEFDYTTNTYTKIMAPGGHATYNHPSFFSNFLQLPDGSVLFAGMYSASDFYVYKPGGSQMNACVPIITAVKKTSTRHYTIIGANFHGFNTGSSYGDDSQPSTNYPIVRLIAGKRVYYARTFNWTLKGTNSVNCTVPASVPPGTYLMTVVVNGFESEKYQVVL